MSTERDKEIDYAFKIARQAIDETGYGGWVSDDKVRDLTARVINGIEDRRAYTPAVKSKVESFQKAHGLQVDGQIGSQTWAKVEELLAEKKAAPGGTA